MRLTDTVDEISITVLLRQPGLVVRNKFSLI